MVPVAKISGAGSWPKVTNQITCGFLSHPQATQHSPEVTAS